MRKRVRKLGRLSEIQFDEMQSFERSKCLPLSIPLIVEPRTRKIIGLSVCSMPATGLLARISIQKYGPRADDRNSCARELWEKTREYLNPSPRIMTDMNPAYPGWISPHFNKAQHVTVKGRRGCVVGQGELKRIGYDPLFDLNHTCAMIRANINRLARRTWCTTKKADRLLMRLELYRDFHNRELT